MHPDQDLFISYSKSILPFIVLFLLAVYLLYDSSIALFRRYLFGSGIAFHFSFFLRQSCRKLLVRILSILFSRFVSLHLDCKTKKSFILYIQKVGIKTKKQKFPCLRKFLLTLNLLNDYDMKKQFISLSERGKI